MIAAGSMVLNPKARTTWWWPKSTERGWIMSVEGNEKVKVERKRVG